MRLSDIEATITIKESKSIIKEHRSVGQILLELNVINIPAIDNFITPMASSREIPDGLKRWFIDRSKKYIINSEDNNELITNFSRNAEPWMKKRQKEGVALYKFTPTNQLRTDLEHTLDWLTSLYNNAGGAGEADQARMASSIRTIKGLKNMSMAQAIEASQSWMGKIDATVQGKGNISLSDEGEGIQKVLDVGDGYTWYTLTSDECITREGHRVQNCLKNSDMGYARKVKEGYTQIFSLRDKGNNPYVSVEVSRNQLIQVKGKQNRAPIPKYIPYVVPMLNKLNVPPNNQGMGDIRAMNIMFDGKNNKYGTLFDLAEIIDKSDDFITYKADIRPEYSSYFFTDHKNFIIAKIDQSKEYYRRPRQRRDQTYPDLQLPYTTISESEKQQIAQYIASVGSKINTNVNIWELSEYLSTDENGKITSYNNIGKKLLGNEEENFRLINNDERTSRIVYVKNGVKLDTIILNLSDDKNYIDASQSMHDIRESSFPMSQFIKLINKLPLDERPYIIDSENNDNILFQGDDFKISDKVSDVGKRLVKSGSIGAYEALTATSSGSEYVENTSIYISGENTFIKLNKLNYKIPSITVDKSDLADIANVLNKLKIGSLLPEDSISTLEDNGIYYDMIKEKFASDITKSGLEVKNYGSLSTLKTANSIRIYDNKKQEILRLNFGNDRFRTWQTSDKIKIDSIQYFNRLKVLKTRIDLANILNDYTISTASANYGKSFQDEMKLIGLAYSTYNEGWKGVAKQPTKLGSGNAKNKTYEIYELSTRSTNELLIYNATDEITVASLIGSKDAVYELEVYNDSYDTMIARAIKLLHDNNKGMLIKNVTEYGREHRSDKRHKMKFYKTLWKNGFVHHPNYGVKDMEEHLPSSTIARTKTGKWVKEAYNEYDPKINDFLDSKEGSGIDNASPLVPDGRITDNASITSDINDKNDEYYTFYRKNKPLLRVVVDIDRTDRDEKKISIIYTIDGDKVSVATNSILIHFKSEIGKLINLIKLSGSTYLIKNGLYYKRSKLHEIKDNPKMVGYLNNKIVYEDDHYWEYTKYGDYNWILQIETETSIKSLIKVYISEEGLEKITYGSKKIRRNPKLYQPHLNDLIDIVSDLYGGEY